MADEKKPGIIAPPDAPPDEERSQVLDEAAALILRPALAKLIEAVGPELAAKHLGSAFAAHITGGGATFAFAALHDAHVQVHAILMFQQKQEQSRIVRLS